MRIRILSVERQLLLERSLAGRNSLVMDRAYECDETRELVMEISLDSGTAQIESVRALGM